jgi:trans-aconitate methyltransferase
MACVPPGFVPAERAGVEPSPRVALAQIPLSVEKAYSPDVTTRASAADPPPLDADAVLALFTRHGDEPDPYLAFHARRIAFLVELLAPQIEMIARRRSAPARLLDVGPGHLTKTIAHRFGESVVIDTLGFADDPFRDDSVRQHFGFDLNDSQDEDLWPSPDDHDIVIAAEVIEHVHTSPRLVLLMLETFLVPGGLIVIQTPNATALPKRIAMLRGRNPFEMIRETPRNPGHFREYTAAELNAYLEQAGFVVEATIFSDHHPDPRPVGGSARAGRTSLALWKERALARAARWHAPFREGITLMARRRDRGGRDDSKRVDGASGTAGQNLGPRRSHAR